jgi:3-oxoacyl-[acyl-carrier-protein] synthase II
MSDEDKISTLAAALALQDAGFKLEYGKKTIKAAGISNCSVIMGTGFSGLETALQAFVSHTFGGALPGTWPNQKHRFHRMVIPMTMPNSVAAWISILFSLKGNSFTVNASCASGTYAVGEAFRKIKDGYDNIVLTGGVECLKENMGGIMRGFDMLGALTKSENGLPVPFSKNRSGFLFSEGAGCVIVLEELEHALSRGAGIYAEIVDYQTNNDAFNIVQMEPSGISITSLLLNLIGNKKIDYINAHGTGTLPNDEIEAKLIQEIFGGKSKQPFINSTKGIAGHSIGASGALEAAITAISIKEQRIHGNIVPNPIDDLNIPLQTISSQIDYALSTSYGFGGHNGGLLFKRYE